MQQQTVYNLPQDELDEELTINLKKILMVIWSRKSLIIKVFCSILLFFIVLTFVLPKKYKVDADLYISKTNNSNISEINPFVIDEVGGSMFSMSGSDKAINNEIELIQSPLVIDKVIKENHLVYKKIFGIFPNRKEGELITTASFLKKGKNLPIENKKNTNVINISYKSKDPELAYNIISSVIKNYIELHKEINSYKSKSDKAIIEKEYNRVKKELDKSVNTAGGLPSSAVSGAGNLTAMSAFSRTASRALGNIKGQYIAGEKSKVEISENAAKVNSLSQKLEWAKLVEDMSDTSKVLVLKEPQKLRDFEYSSPKLLINIILGILFGAIGALIAIIAAEIRDKKLCYSELDDNIIYNIEDEYTDLQVYLLANTDKPVSFVMFDNLSPDIMEKLKEYKNVKFIRADITSEFMLGIKDASDVILVAKINATNRQLYKHVKTLIKEVKKNIVNEILV